MELALDGKKVLVTGSSRGIGLAIAEGFLQEKARVMLTSRNHEELEEIASAFKVKYGQENVSFYACDFRDLSNIMKLRSEVVNIWGGLDIVVANVGSGVSVADPIPEAEHFGEIFHENFYAAVNTAREFLPMLSITKGNMIFVSSVAGLEAIGAPIDYASAKTALLSFAKNLSWKVASVGIRVNCIAPGNIYFPGGTWDCKLQQDPERITRLLADNVPLNRFGRPEEIADAVLFLCSSRAAFITGACLVVDGGQTRSLA